MVFPSYIFCAAPVAGTEIVVIRSNPHNLKPNLLEHWDVASGERLRVTHTTSSFTRTLAASVEAGIAVGGNDDGVLYVWSLANGDVVHKLDLRGTRKHAFIGALALLKQGRQALVASGWGDHSVGLWDLESGACLMNYAGFPNEVWGFCVLPGEARFLTASGDRSVKLWDIASGACLRTFVEAGLPAFVPHLEARDDQSATGVCILRDGRRAVSAHGDGMLRCWDLESGALLHKARTALDWARWLLSVAASPVDGKVLAGSWDNNVWLWEPGGEPVPMSGHIGEAGPVFFLDNGLAVSVSFDQTIRVWDIERRECVRVIGEPIKSSRSPPNESMY